MITPIFTEVLNKFKRNTPVATSPNFNEDPSPTNHKGQLFFHIPYHPRDISRKSIREAYESSFHNNIVDLRNFKNDETEATLRISQFTVAYSRPRNLRDLLCPSSYPVIEENKTVGTILARKLADS